MLQPADILVLVMPTDTKKKNSISDGQAHRSALLLFATVADTTWRMFVPILGLMLLGLWVDNSNATKPLYTFIGLGAGVLVAVALVWLQIKQVMSGKK